MSAALQRTNLPPPFIITLQGITPTKKMAKDAHDPPGTGIMHTVPCFEEVCVRSYFICYRFKNECIRVQNN